MAIEVEIDQQLSNLTKGQTGYYKLGVEGYTRAQQAEMVNRTIKTVDSTWTAIFQRLGVENIQQAITIGFAKGIIKVKHFMWSCIWLSTLSSISAQVFYVEPAQAADLFPKEGYHSIDAGNDGLVILRVRGRRGRGRSRSGSRYQRSSSREKSLLMFGGKFLDGYSPNSFELDDNE